MPYNDSKFQLLGKYKQVFRDVPELNDGKYYKIKYTLNILPSVTYDGDECTGVSDLLEALSDTDEQSVF